MSETSEMVERVGRQLGDLEMWPGYDLRRLLDDEVDFGGADVVLRRIAEAAIRAMREPTEAMTKAGVAFALGVSLSGEYPWPAYIADMHRRQIDAALPSPPATR